MTNSIHQDDCQDDIQTRLHGEQWQPNHKDLFLNQCFGISYLFDDLICREEEIVIIQRRFDIWIFVEGRYWRVQSENFVIFLKIISNSKLRLDLRLRHVKASGFEKQLIINFTLKGFF